MRIEASDGDGTLRPSTETVNDKIDGPSGALLPGLANTPLSERFMRYITPEPFSGCWLWFGCWDSHGYGKITVARKTFYTHRLAFELCVAPIPHGLHLDHLCRTPCCAYPGHLEPVTPLVNTHRGRASEANRQRHAARTHCIHGHAYGADNVQLDRNGARSCKKCRRAAEARWRANRRDSLLGKETAL